jgi:glutathione S-transferase
MLKIWGRRNSFNVQKVMWLVGELGLEHQHIDAGGSFGGLDRPEFLQMNPHGRVPVVDDDGVIVWESHSIIRYLSAKYGRDSFWIEEPAQRSFADRGMDWSLATLQPDFMDLFGGFYRTRPKNVIGRRSTPWSRAVPNTFGCSIGTWPGSPAWRETGLPWPIFPPAPRCTATLSSKSPIRWYPT